jgi:hypothetical protein
MLSASEIEQALRNSGYEFKSTITSANCTNEVDTNNDLSDVGLAGLGRTPIQIYDVTWEVSKETPMPDLVTFCDTVYITTDKDGTIYGDI